MEEFVELAGGFGGGGRGCVGSMYGGDLGEVLGLSMEGG